MRREQGRGAIPTSKIQVSRLDRVYTRDKVMIMRRYLYFKLMRYLVRTGRRLHRLIVMPRRFGFDKLDVPRFTIEEIEELPPVELANYAEELMRQRYLKLSREDEAWLYGTLGQCQQRLRRYVIQNERGKVAHEL